LFMFCCASFVLVTVQCNRCCLVNMLMRILFSLSEKQLTNLKAFSIRTTNKRRAICNPDFIFPIDLLEHYQAQQPPARFGRCACRNFTKSRNNLDTNFQKHSTDFLFLFGEANIDIIPAIYPAVVFGNE